MTDADTIHALRRLVERIDGLHREYGEKAEMSGRKTTIPLRTISEIRDSEPMAVARRVLERSEVRRF